MEYRKGTKVFTNWTIEKELGEGATGRVFEIQKTDYGITTRSALKVIRVPRSSADLKAALAEGMDGQSVSSYFQGFVDEIVKEIVIMTELKSHPNIVSYEDHHVMPHEDGFGWDILIRMELLTPLLDYQLGHMMTENDVIRMGRELTDALTFCQEKGLIHRDIKPENIFVSEAHQFKLGDFGVARTVEKTTGGLSRKGTEKYMAPEVYLGKPYNQTVDLYSLGLVLYSFMNRGRLPFYPQDKNQISFSDRESAMDRRMRGDEIPAPADASPEFASVILKACAFLPGDRYRTAQEMSADLKRLNRTKGSSQITGMTDCSQEEKTVGMFAEEQTMGMFRPEPKKGKDIYQGLNLDAGLARVGCVQRITVQGKTVLVKIPAGIRTGEEIRIRGLGESGINGGKDGDLCVRIYIKEQTAYVAAEPEPAGNIKRSVNGSAPRKGMDVYCGINLDAGLARTGCMQSIAVQGRTVLVTIPAGIQSGQEIRLWGLGKPGINGGANGDFCIRVYIK